MNPIQLLPICVAIAWVLHAYLRLSQRKQSRYTFWLFLGGLPALAIALFVSAAVAEDPDPSRFALGHVGDGGMVAMLLSLETIGLWIVVGFAEFILTLISSQVLKPGPTDVEVTAGVSRR